MGIYFDKSNEQESWNYFLCAQLTKMSYFTHIFNINMTLLDLRGMFEMNCLFLSGDFKFQVSLKYSFHALEVLPVARNAKF